MSEPTLGMFLVALLAGPFFIAGNSFRPLYDRSRMNAEQLKIRGYFWDPPMDLVSVVIPAYNSKKRIETTLNSVLAQSYPELEIIVVDDGSRDRTAEIAEHALRGFQGPLKVLRQPNQRVIAARNTGWRAARGSWIHFVDSYDVIVSDAVKLLMTVAEKSSPETAVVYSSWQRVAGEGDQLLPVEEMQTPQLDEKPPPASLLVTKGNIQTGSFLVRRAWLDATRGFDEGWGRFQDTEFLLRIAMANDGFRFASSSSPSAMANVPRPASVG